ncbi:outer membrane transport energization protein TonB [Cellulophaga sp. RHA19]|uniref:energy transducer TonB n=1 Tax=Cellulophaga sp. RHA19 TaxID=1798237 RepID=UPI000C2C82DA|nr:energy transducer TonB [Cellulophaga sp. RHA19]PKB41902.1 outer membrane transport energization protein TonB [Cellulophaga sp. RHA19]
MSFLDTKHKKKSFTLTTLLLSVLLLLLFYFGFTTMDPPEEKGIAVNFGQMDFGKGNVQPKEKIKSEPVKTTKEVVEEQQEEVKPVAEPEVQQESAQEKAAEKLVTQDNEESILIKQKQEAKRKADAAAKKAKAEAERKEQQRVAAEKAEAERKRKAEQAKRDKVDNLFGGLAKSDGKATGGEGDDNKAGDKGNPQGNPYATSYYGSPGSGSGGSGYGLSGRKLLNKGQVKQDCNEEGRVVVKIVVDRNGKVLSATAGVKGTTNNHPCLLKPAEATARLHKWNLDTKAPSRQIGFVVVNFKLGE